jgi:hypothetical protein
MACSSKSSLSVSQKFPSLLLDAYTIPSGQQLTVTRHATVKRNGGAKLSLMTNVTSTSALENSKFEIIRTNTKTNEAVSITNGAQILLTLTGSGTEFNFVVSMVDTTVTPGNYKYAFMVYNTSSGVLNIDFSSFIVNTNDNLRFFTSDTSQKFVTPADPPVAVIPKGTSQSFQFTAKVYEKGGVIIDTNLNIALTILNNQNIQAKYNILRDGQSITNGDQFLYNLGKLKLAQPVTFEDNVSFTLVDADAEVGDHTYTLVVSNTGLVNFYVDFISFSATTNRNCNGHTYATQVYPAITDPDAIVIAPLTRVEIPVVSGRSNAAQLSFSLNINSIVPGSISMANLLFDILRCSDDKDVGVSIINGPQTLIRSGPTTVSPIGSANRNFTLSFTCVDKQQQKGCVMYKLVLLNNSTVNNANVDHYSFNVSS